MLSKHSSAPTRWLKKSKSRNAVPEKLPADRDGIVPLLKTNKRDIDREVVRELGFSYAGWAPLDGGASVAFAATIGSFSTVVGNYFALAFDTETEPGG